MESAHLGGSHLGRRQLVVAAGAAVVCASCSAAEQVITDVVGDGNTSSIGFGTPFNLGAIADVIATIRENDGFWYRPDGRMWLTEYPADSLPQARLVYSSSELVGMEAGVVALFQKCPHLGCRVPSCATSQWFECPCHGSKYNRVGEHRAGPSPRGMDRFAVEINDQDDLIVYTDQIISGPPSDTNTTGQEPAGPYCIGEASH